VVAIAYICHLSSLLHQNYCTPVVILMKTRKPVIIGHRGAAGLAPENTIASIKAARKAGVNLVELDVRITRDNELVLCHDPSTERTYGVDLVIKQHSLRELRTLCQELPTLDEALHACKDTPVILEIKDVFDPKLLLDVIAKYPEL